MPYISIVWGAVSGIGYAMNGWFSKAKEKDSKFDWKKFTKTAIIGAIIGGAATQFGMTFETMSASLQGLGILTAIDVGVLAFVNKIWKKISNL